MWEGIVTQQIQPQHFFVGILLRVVCTNGGARVAHLQQLARPGARFFQHAIGRIRVGDKVWIFFHYEKFVIVRLADQHGDARSVPEKGRIGVTVVDLHRGDKIVRNLVELNEDCPCSKSLVVLS